MAKRKAPRRVRKAAAPVRRKAKKPSSTRRARRAPAARGRTKRAVVAPRKRKSPRKSAARRRAANASKRLPAKVVVQRKRSARPVRSKPPALDRARRMLHENDIVQTPPSTLDRDRRGTAVRTGHAAIAQHLREHHESGPALTGGDVDANWEGAYATGDEAPGGDNPTPDQDVVDEIGKALGIEYDDAEELKGAAKVEERDRRRWELDPASSEDYRDRKK